MALMVPLLLMLMFGAFELGNYFWNDHIVAKAARDGARFASRQSFGTMPCAGTPTNEAAIKNIVRYGNTAGTGTLRVSGFSNASTVTVALSCAASGTYSGIYSSTAQVPVVTVSVDVPYRTLFSAVGISTTSLRVRGRSQAAVMGI